MHKYAIVPSSYHQCLKGIWAEKKVMVRASDRPFVAHEANLSNALCFTKMSEAAQAVIAKPHGVKIPKWEDIKNEKENTWQRDPVSADATTPKKITKVRERGKMVYCL